MSDRYKGDKAIFIADRYYAAYNNMAHLEELGEKYYKNHTDKKDGKKIKVCTDCTFPHRPENYDKIIQILIRNNNN